MMSTAYDTAIKVELADNIIAAAENYNSWSNLEASKSDFVEDVLNLLFNFGLKIDD